MAHTSSMPMCPMAESCKGMMEKPLSGFVLIVPGILAIIALVFLVFLLLIKLLWAWTIPDLFPAAGG